MRVEHRVISHDEIWKFKTVDVGSVVEAQIWFNGDGTINEERTFSSNYLSQHSSSRGSSRSSQSRSSWWSVFVDDEEDDCEEDEYEDEEDDVYEYTAYRVSGDGNALFPDKIIIADDYVIYRKGRIIGYKETMINRSAIGSVTLDKHLLFADIIIETNGGKVIRAHGFSRGDAQQIADLLE